MLSVAMHLRDRLDDWWEHLSERQRLISWSAALVTAETIAVVVLWRGGRISEPSKLPGLLISAPFWIFGYVFVLVIAVFPVTYFIDHVAPGNLLFPRNLSRQRLARELEGRPMSTWDVRGEVAFDAFRFLLSGMLAVVGLVFTLFLIIATIWIAIEGSDLFCPERIGGPPLC